MDCILLILLILIILVLIFAWKNFIPQQNEVVLRRPTESFSPSQRLSVLLNASPTQDGFVFPNFKLLKSVGVSNIIKQLNNSIIDLITSGLLDPLGTIGDITNALFQNLDPIILIPGVGASNLWGQWSGLPACPNDSPDYTLIYPSLSLFTSSNIDFDMDCIKILYTPVFDPTTGLYSDYPGSYITADRGNGTDFGGVSGIDFLKGAPAMEALILFFRSKGYVPGMNLMGAPYDFRRILSPDVLSSYCNSLKGLIENSYNSYNRPVNVITHSFGGMLAHYFLVDYLNNTLQDGAQAWRDTYIRNFVPMCCPFGGGLTLKYCTSGIDLLQIGLPNEKMLWMQEIYKYISSLIGVFPNPQLFGNFPVAWMNDNLYSASDIPSFCSQSPRWTSIADQYNSYYTNFTQNMLAPPGVNVINVIAKNIINTGGTLLYAEYDSDITQPVPYGEKVIYNYMKDNLTDVQRTILDDSLDNMIGDSAVPYISSMVPKLWVNNNFDGNGNPLAVNFISISGFGEFTNHAGILYNLTMFANLWQYLSGN